MRISLRQAAEMLNEGGVIAVPTETVYGLAASPLYEEAVERIFTVKKRPPNNPLIIHVADVSQIAEYTDSFPSEFDLLAAAFWPGPMTLVIPVKTSLIPSSVRAGLDTAGFRMPEHFLARELLRLTGPLVMPSANLSGRPSSTSAAHVEEDFGSDWPVLDGGSCEKGLESTILGRIGDKWSILRQGAMAPEDFAPVLGYTPLLADEDEEEKPVCPGRLYRHYSPKAKLLTGDRIVPEEASAIVGFSDRSYPKDKQFFLLGSLCDPGLAAKNLYAVFRDLDRNKVKIAWVDIDFPEDGLWATVKERIRRAAQ